MTNEERFQKHCEEASKTVETWAAWKQQLLGGEPVDQFTVYKHREQQLKLEIEGLRQQLGDLRSALCIARVNARDQLGMTLRKFALLCGQSPSWVSRWTDSDSDPQSPPDFVD